MCVSGFPERQALRFVASLEQYSKHPLASGLLRAAEERELALLPADEVSEIPGQGLKGRIGARSLAITGRNGLDPQATARLPAKTDSNSHSAATMMKAISSRSPATRSDAGLFQVVN